MLCSLALKVIGLLAALAASAIASPAAQQSEVYVPPPSGFPADVQILSYKLSHDKLFGQDPTKAAQACETFISDCRYARSFTPDNSSVVFSCTNDQKNQLVTGSCVMADCDGRAWSYTLTIPFTDHFLEPPIFRKTKPCGNVHCVVDPSPESDRDPVLLGDGKILFKDTCPYAPPFGFHIK